MIIRKNEEILNVYKPKQCKYCKGEGILWIKEKKEENKLRTNKIKRFLVEALAGFVFWTVALTPYMLFVVKVTFKQYTSWIGMQLILVPPIAPLSVRFIIWLRNKLVK